MKVRLNTGSQELPFRNSFPSFRRPIRVMLFQMWDANGLDVSAYPDRSFATLSPKWKWHEIAVTLLLQICPVDRWPDLSWVLAPLSNACICLYTYDNYYTSRLYAIFVKHTLQKQTQNWHSWKCFACNWLMIFVAWHQIRSKASVV